MIHPERVRKARGVVLKYLGDEGMLENSESLKFGLEKRSGKLLTGYEDVTHQNDFLYVHAGINLTYRDLVESPELRLFFSAYYKTPKVATFRTKWLRVKGHTE